MASNDIPALNALGIEYHSNDKGHLTAIHIPWNGDTWMKVLNREGPYLGVCCGTISALRDILVSTLCEGGWMDSDHLLQFLGNMASHDGFDLWFKPGFRPKAKDKKHPLYLFAQIPRDLIVCGWKDKPHTNRPTILLRNCLDAFIMANFFHSFEHEGETPEQRRHREFEHEKLLIDIAAETFVPLKAVYEDFLARFKDKVLTGIAVVAREEPTKVLETRGGFAIYPNTEEAEKVIGWWLKDTSPNDKLRSREDFLLIPCRITLDKGIELLPGA